MLKTTIEKKNIGNLEVVIETTGTVKRYFITANQERNGKKYPLFDNLIEYLKQENAEIISQLVFANSMHYDASIKRVTELSTCFNWPVTWLHGDGCDCDCLTSTQVTAISGVDVQHIILNGSRVGAFFKDQFAEYCYLGDVRTDDISASRPDQALAAYEKMLAALNTVGMDFSNVVRMWNYLDNLLEWYDDFNVMRTAFFNKYKIFDGIVPAGTGIGAGNPAGTAYVGELLAVKPISDSVEIAAVPSPLQCPAIDYKSSFSRAVRIDTPPSRYLSISGTASIEPGGKTVNLDDTAAQIDLTMRVISGILDSLGMQWSDTVKAIAYFKDINEKNLLTEFLTNNNYPDIPIAVSHADICRDDLLFELELDAVKVNS